MTKNVATPLEDVTEREAEWHLVRSLFNGTAAMRRAGKRYLPQEPGESEDSYKNRLSRSVLFNAFRKTITDMAGRIFAKEVALGDGASSDFKSWIENIDLAGRHLNTFAMDVFTDGMQTGIAHIIVEMPNAVEGETRASAAAKGVRPYLVHVKAEDVIGWRSGFIDGKQQLTMLRIREEVEIPAGDYDVECIEQIRVYLPGAYEIWRKKDGARDEWVLFDAGPRGIMEIPISTFYAERTEFMEANPPLKDLADLNVCHWQSQSDQRNILHVARVPILFGAGFAEDMTLNVGAGTFTRASDPGAKLSYVEHSGAAISSGLEDIKMLEFQMQTQGLQLLVNDPGQSATGEIRDDVKENSRLAKIAFNLKDALENAMVWMAVLSGNGNDGPEVLVNTDFGITARGSQDLTILLNAVNAGQISRETFWHELMRRGVLSPEFDPDMEAETIDMQAPDMADIPPGNDNPPTDNTKKPDLAAALREAMKNG